MKEKIKTVLLAGEYEDYEQNGIFVIKVPVDEVLDALDPDDISQYAHSWCGMINKDDCISDISEFQEHEIVSYLDDSYFNWYSKIDEDSAIDYLEDRGYIVLESKDLPSNSYDYTDSVLFDEISEVFDSLSFSSRQKLRDLVIKFKEDEI